MDDRLDFELVLRKMVVLNESITLISNYTKTNTFHLSILGELGVKESWIKLFFVAPFPCVLHPIGAGINGDIFFVKDNELVRCDLSTQMIKELGIKGVPFGTRMGIYNESFLPIGGINN
ncbi:F-box protein interaction domain protein [Spatholobus suberectus]|nr:F-box protein interaction domain protein [Spatholobus suberectus]